MYKKGKQILDYELSKTYFLSNFFVFYSGMRKRLIFFGSATKKSTASASIFFKELKPNKTALL